MSNPLTNQQIQQLHTALLDAYNIDALQMMLKLQLDEDLETIVPVHKRTLDQIAMDLIRVYAAREGGLHQLMDAALADNPTNPHLTATATELRSLEYAVLPLPDDFGGGDVIHGDKIAGDKINVGDITDGQVIAIGTGATAIYQGLTIEEVNTLFAEWREAETVPVWDGRTPYIGLSAFQESDAEFFFGRENLVDDLLKRMESSNFVTISGPSGSGKSSVARAGLLHALRMGSLERSDTWLLATMQPRGNPIEQLALAMARLSHSPATQTHILENADSDPQTLHKQAELLLSDDPRQKFVLLVDQFEETFTQTNDERVREIFVNLLTHTADMENGRVIIVLALRSDFISHCMCLINEI